MANAVLDAPSAQRFSLEALLELAQVASHSLDTVRSDMLEPHPRKTPPVFTGAQVARLAGVEPKQMTYLAKRGDLPSGSHEANGARRMFTLAEARQYVSRLSKIPKRPAGAPGATIAIVNFKGGSTKTTTAFNLAQGLTLRGRRVLICDLDPQASSTTLTGLLPAAEVMEDQTAAPLFIPPLSEAPKDLRYAVQRTYWDGLDIIPAAPALFGAEIFLPIHSRDPDIAWWDMLNRAITPLREDYDVIIFDTAPALSYLAVNAVIASDGLIMPVPPETLDFASSVAFWNLLSETLGALASGRRYHKDFAFMRVLLSKVDSKLASSLVRDWIIKTYGPYMLPVEIPKSPAGSLSAIKFGTVYDLGKYSGGVSADTYGRIRDAFDKFVEMIDQSVQALVWKVAAE
ncbi:ParA family protein [uncultured Azohydromonas sp.]|jgi:ATPases involved in chromosome partitioning|uniref:ParA family protein n=1 Tax=uncultured Azohydromonas sp. TaxID=487342 RepID=UPI0026201029|nr:AAA family ATPase [uncultured Azohydromonas sp.]